MAEIQLTRGKVALIDDIDSDLSEFNWCYHYMHSNNCYAERRANHKVVYLHRVILERMIGCPVESGFVCDHIYGDGLDNRRSNLRVITNQQNQWNKRRNETPKSSQYKGVSKASGGKWTARIKFNMRLKHLGTFKTEVEAALAYDKAAISLYGDFAKPNFQSSAP